MNFEIQDSANAADRNKEDRAGQQWTLLTLSTVCTMVEWGVKWREYEECITRIQTPFILRPSPDLFVAVSASHKFDLTSVASA